MAQIVRSWTARKQWLTNRTVVKGLAATCSVVLIAGCTMVGPDYAPPQTQMPDQWHQDLTSGLEEGESNLQTWWTELNDPVLNDLIERAAIGNLNVKQALARVEASRSAIGVAAGEQLPAVDASGLIEYGQLAKTTAPNLSGSGRTRSAALFNAGMDATWEIDFWGRISRSVEAADATFQASVEDYRDSLVILFAEVASQYIQVRTFQERIQSALGNVRTQQQTLRLVEDRRRAGLASDLDRAQARLNLARTEAAVPFLREQLGLSVHQLGVLLGEKPSALYPILGEPTGIPDPPKDVLVAVPHELLRQRPDIRSAERQLAAQTANIGIATADLYPRFSLFGFFAFEAFDAGLMFNANGFSYGVGPSVRWNFLDGGRVRSQIDVEDATAQGLLVAYEQTVLEALQEVEDAMVGFVQEQARRDALARSVEAARTATRLVTELYVTGLTDFQNVQDTERNRFEQEDLLADSEGLVVQNLVALYKALGGGWGASPARTADVDEDAEGRPAGSAASGPTAAAVSEPITTGADETGAKPKDAS